MHKKAVFVSLFLVIALLGYMTSHFLWVDSSDKAAYENLQNLTKTDTAKESKTRQDKTNVRKELWNPYGGKRLHTRLISDSSRLTLARSEGKEEVVEEMQNVFLLTQEELKDNFQTLRIVIAKEATYFFKDERVVAERVKLFRFKLPGEILPEEFPTEKPLMEGEAKWVEFYLKEGRVDLNASEATLRSPEKKIEVSSQSLLFDGRMAYLDGDVILKHPFGDATSNKATLTYDKNQAKGPLSDAVLEGNVVFIRPDNSKLSCEKAVMNFEKETGEFTPVAYLSKGIRLTADEGEAKLRYEDNRWVISTILFKGHVLASDSGKGTIATDKEVLVEMGPKTFSKIISEGPSVLTRVDEQKNRSHTIVAPGLLVVDHEAKKTILNRSEEAQIHFTDSFGEIYADKVTIFYEQGEKNLKVKSILMEGKVFMAHSLPSEVERSYGYADEAEYFPETMEMVLVGDRVLIFDKINQVEVSAPKLRIRRDQVTKKETIRGEGDVRFSLEEKEYQALKNRFKLDDKETNDASKSPKS